MCWIIYIFFVSGLVWFGGVDGDGTDKYGEVIPVRIPDGLHLRRSVLYSICIGYGNYYRVSRYNFFISLKHQCGGSMQLLGVEYFEHNRKGHFGHRCPGRRKSFQ